MKNLTVILSAVVVTAAVCAPASGAIVYSGSQNVTLALSPMSPMDSQVIELGGMAGDWDDFRVDLWLESGMMSMMSMPGMTYMGTMSLMGMGTKLVIYAPGSIGMPMGMGAGMGMGGILGLQSFASKLLLGGPVAPDSFFDVFLELYGSGEFGEDGGYIGLRTAQGQYGWLHMASQENIGTDTHRVTFDGWALEDLPDAGVGAGEGGPCDWVPGKPFKMHWPQLPDLSVMGVDVSLSRTVLADDFKCTATGPINDIHFWGSFRDDILPKDGPGALTLELSIYSDIPAQDNVWSRPGELLWQRVFAPGEYTARPAGEGPEDWYDPATDAYLPGNHRGAYQYNFCIDKDPFIQQEGKIYWLAVKDLSAGANYAFGWKTTPPKLGWNDSCVFWVNTSGMSWTSLAYPKLHKYALQPVGLAFVITSSDDDEASTSDLGDAPDSTNSIAGATMLAYPSGVVARFPTVYQAGSPPYGPLHRQPRDLFFLGKWVSLETEADLGPDQDIVNNLDPLNDAANQDGADDGLVLPVNLPFCQETTVDYVVTVTNPLTKPAYVNVWCDWNRDGDWDDTLTCADGTIAPEWAVQNQVPVLPGPGTYTVTSPSFRCWHPTKDGSDPMWLRLTISEQPWGLVASSAAVGGGSGPAGGYQYGETEDYYFLPRATLVPSAVKYDWGDAPETAAAAGYPTLAASNGARHVPVGPWFGNNADVPDSEPDGQPEASALGDDINGTSDENGVCIPPLVAGQAASVTVEVNGGGGVVQGWIDFNADRTWDSSEKIFDGFLPNGVHVLPFIVPNTLLACESPFCHVFARFRISTKGGLEPTGPAADGEVEDHEVSIEYAPSGDKTWCQPPDLTPYGIDIRVDGSDNLPRVLADDFPCREPGQLTRLRFWGSWRDDRKGEIKKIRVRIHPDDPVGPGGFNKENKYSMPGPEILWEKEFLPGEFQEMLYHVVRIAGEWWWDPVSGKSLPGGDTQVWLLDLPVKPEDAFLQDGTPEKPRIYWLALEVEAAGGEFGWKTRQWPGHFLDDAVWDAEATTTQTWDELRYPPGHRYFEHKRNSIDLAFCLVFTTGTTPPATAQPVAMTQCPPVETTCPALLTTCPTAETRCPSLLTKCPASATKCPESLTKCPPTATKCQVVQTQCPAVETQCPPANTKCPVSLTKCPETLTRCPPTVTECQGADTQCPTVETKCPPIETKCPVSETKCPEYQTKCPPTPTECRVIQTECPAVETECPPISTKCPVYSTRCPESFTKCPPTVTECQGADTQCPTVETKCPPIETKCPLSETKCPVVDTKCPTAKTQCPVVSTQCPLVPTKCPMTVTECQAVDTQCPPIETKCPVVSTECPVSTTKCPEYLTKCPPTATECRTVDTECPVYPTRCPPEPTKCPPTVSECQTIPTECPVVVTQCPEVRTQCMSTQCPPVPTQCPPALTQCPPTLSTCSGKITACATCPIGTGGAGGTGGISLGAACPTVETFCPTLSDYLLLAQAVK